MNNASKYLTNTSLILFLFISCSPVLQHNRSKPELKFLQDTTGKLTYQEVMLKELDFQEPTGANINFGTEPGVYWFLYKSEPGLPEEQLLTIGGPTQIKYLDVFCNGNHVYASGALKPFSARPIQYRHFTIPIPPSTEVSTKYWIRIDAYIFINIPVTLESSDEFRNKITLEYYFLGIFFGVVLAMILYNLALAFMLREPAYFYYVFYSICMALFLIQEDGLLNQIFAPDFGWNGNMPILILTSLPAAAMLFTRSFLDVKNFNPRLNNFFSLAILFSICLAGMSLLGIESWAGTFAILDINLLSVITLCITAIVQGVLKGKKSAFYMVYAFSIFLFFLILRLLVALASDYFSFVNYNLLTEGIKIGTGLELIILSMGLANRYSTLREQFRATRLKFRAERERLNQEVHDSIGSELAGALMQLRNKNIESGILQRIQKALDTTRDLTSLLNLTHKADSSFESDIRAFVQNFKGLDKFSFELEFDQQLNQCSLKQRLNCYRIMQEWISNCIRHGHARKFEIRFIKHHKCLLMLIISDGTGFSWHSCRAITAPGIGLRSIQNRLIGIQATARSFKKPDGKNLFISRVPLN